MKDKINLKYFTSNLSELPGPLNRNMKKMKDVRKNSIVNKTYDDKLYNNFYRIVS